MGFGKYFSDSLFKYGNQVSDQEILYEVIHGGERSMCCQRLVDIVLDRGAPDNVTVVLLTADDNEQ